MAVMTNGFGIATGIYGAIELGAVLLGKEIPVIPRKLRVAIFVPILLCAQFLAWKGEHERWLQADAAKTEADGEAKRLQGMLNGKDETIGELRNQLAARPPQIQIPPIEIPAPVVLPIRERSEIVWSQENQATVLSVLSASEFKSNIAISTATGAVDALRNGEILPRILRSAGWPTVSVGQAYVTGTVTGITIEVQSQDNQAAAVLQNALRRIGIEARGRVNPNMEPDRIRLVFGSSQ